MTIEEKLKQLNDESRKLKFIQTGLTSIIGVPSPSEFLKSARNKLDVYINEVPSGKVVTGKYERLAVERFLEFKSKYSYNENEVRRPLKFLSLIHIPINNK